MVRAIGKDGQEKQRLLGWFGLGKIWGTGELTAVMLKVEGQEATSAILNAGNSGLTLRTLFLHDSGQTVGGGSEKSYLYL